MIFAKFWLIGSCLVLNAVCSLPIDDNAIDYLRNYGYLPKTSSRFGDDILHEDTATNALKALQRLGNIPETGFLDDATKALLRKPRCGNPDFETIPTNSSRHRRQKRYVLGPTKWDKLDVTWKYLNRNYPRGEREHGQIRRLIYEAMEFWQHNSNLKLRETADERADILIDFARGNHGDNFNFNGAGGSLAHAFYPGSGLGGDVHLDEDELWDIENGVEGDVNFFYTLLHELGHSIGLGHSSTVESIMYPWYSNGRTFDRSTKELYDDDKWGIEQLYGKKSGKSWGPIAPRKTTRRFTTTTTARPRFQTTEVSTTKAPKPDKCNISYDAIGIIRNELMIFKGIWMWRFRDGRLLQGYPVEFFRMWPELQSFDHIDAVFERKDGKFVFFIGDDVVVIDSHQKVYTHNLEYLGFHRNIKKIDAIFTWGYNNRTYVFSGPYFWRVDDNLHVDNSMNKYPRPIRERWDKVNKIKIDTGFQTGGKTYFFSGKAFYLFNDESMTLEIRNPRASSKVWMNCQLTDEELSSIQRSARIQSEEDLETSTAPSTVTVSVFTFLLAFANIFTF
ncbi:CLUMA_CG019084, isoform A [Clunio marinus]|uniref:CLUMA_CG019084, isoform A n=1 Tax=Clunio marinus TaxID=568069 RepID=A0A1J1J410_9DIPT|nr:CLUMA_CG019084, isoform A [Clunio marinus]